MLLSTVDTRYPKHDTECVISYWFENIIVILLVYDNE